MYKISKFKLSQNQWEISCEHAVGIDTIEKIKGKSFLVIF